MDFYLPSLKQSLSKWQKDKKLYGVNWHQISTGKPMVSSPLNYLVFSKILREQGVFEPEKLNLPPMECHWLDRTLDVSMNFHYFDDGSKNALFILDGTPQEQYGEKYPIKPSIDREGHIFTTFQPQLIKRIIRERKSLIENSEKCLTPDWVMDFRALINDSISLLDITLTQLYIKAEYSPEPGWTFNVEKLGQKNNRRMKDKLKWVRQISGNAFDIEFEFTKLDRLRILRNHLNHFDPPTFVITLEEAVSFLNDILYIGQILIKIRQTIKVPISVSLINLIIQREAHFNPEKAFEKSLLIEGQSGGHNFYLETKR